MSKERMDNEEEYFPDKDSESVRNELLDYLKGAPVNSFKYQAFMDYQCENDLDTELERLIDSINIPETNFKEWYQKESQIKITEHRIALQEHTIEQKKMTVPGYDEAFTIIWGNFFELGQTLLYEGEKKFPKNKKARDNYAENGWNEVMEVIRIELTENS